MPRARDLGIPLDGTPGPWNGITDVSGVQVGHATLIEGDSIRTGVTAIFPRERRHDPVFAGTYTFNGNGDMFGTHWIEESGFLETPILLTNTHSLGTVRDAALMWQRDNKYFDPYLQHFWFTYPVVAETYDGFLNDINGFHVKAEHAWAALDGARSGPVAEGNVGGGTGMKCHAFKGGIGTASRLLPDGHTLGVLVQANHGRREPFRVAGVHVGREITDLMPVLNTPPGAREGSIIAIIATDAPLLPHQLKRLARRVPLGIALLGGVGDNSSGDIFLAFSTANPGAAGRKGLKSLEMMPNDAMNPLFDATVQATEEAILNALVAAETMTGVNGNVVHALPRERVSETFRKHHRLGGE